MQTWTHEKLLAEYLKAYVKFSNCAIEENDKEFNKRLDKWGRIENEALRRFSLTDNDRRKTYKNGYDQGRFDEGADTLNETEPYQRGKLSPMKHIGTFTAEAEYKGKLPKRERIENDELYK